MSITQDYTVTDEAEPMSPSGFLIKKTAGSGETMHMLPGYCVSDCQFDVLVKSYNKHSKQWSAVFNRLPEGRNKE